MLLCLAVAGCDGGGGPPPATPAAAPPPAPSGAPSEALRPDVVLLTVDTLRADHLDAYGYARKTGQALERHFEGAATFRRAYSTSSWTAPALASLLTSLHPYQHGVRRGIAPMFLMGEPDVLLQQPLDAAHARLPERLREAGYQTLGLSTNPHVTAALGFDRGFDHFVFLEPREPDAERGVVYADAAAVLEQIRAWRELRDDARPVFLWVHLLDPHLPYHLREPWLDRYRPRQLPPRTEPLLSFPGLGLEDERLATRHAVLTSLYDAEIHFAFERLAELLDLWGIDEETLLILTSDHGESFFEHGKLGHAESLYEPELRIPLRVRFPRSLGLSGDFAEPVSLLDVMPTVLELAGAASPPEAVGESLLPVAGGETRPDRVLLAELVRGGRSLHAAVDDRWKLIEDERDGRHELYDVVRDPNELHDRSRDEPDVRQRLAAALQPQREALAEGGGVEVPPELHRFLRTLGYVDLPDEAPQSAPDPPPPDRPPGTAPEPGGGEGEARR